MAHSLHLFLHSAVQIYECGYIHDFIFIFPAYITKQFNDQLPVGLLAQLVRALHRYRRGQGLNPGKPDFFKLSFRSCISYVNSCEDLVYIYFFIRGSNIWISYIHNFILIFRGYITNQFNDQLPVRLFAQLVRALHQYREARDRIPASLIFLGFLFATTEVALIAARIFFTSIFLFRSSNIWNLYIHTFIFIFPGYITKEFNNQLPAGLLAQLVRELHRYRRGQGSNPGKPDFFRLSFRNCISYVNTWEGLLCI